MDSQAPTRFDRYLKHIVAYCFALHFFLGSIAALNASNLSYFYYFPARIHIVIAGPVADNALWLTSITVLSSILLTKCKEDSWRVPARLAASATIIFAFSLALVSVFGLPATPFVYLLLAGGASEFLVLVRNRRSSLLHYNLRRTLTEALVFLAVFFSAIQISAAVNYTLRPFNLASSAGQADVVTELQLAYAPYGLLPWLYFGFLTSWFWVPLVNKFWKGAKARTLTNLEPEPTQTQASVGLSALLSDPRFYLALALGIFISYYPYFPNLPWLVGTDSYWRYYDPLVRINAQNGIAALHSALAERHPVPLMLLYLTQLLTRADPFNVIKLAPVFLTLLLGFAFWRFLARKASASSGFTAFLFSVFSVTTSLGLYSSIIANWMVLVVWVMFLAYLCYRANGRFRITDFLFLFILSTLMILLHPWTWGVFAAVILAASVFTIIQEKQTGLRVSGALVLIMLLDVAFGLLSITYLAGSQGWRVIDALDLYTYVFQNPSTVLQFWSALNWTIKIWSAFFSPIYIFLAIVGVFAVFRTGLSKWQRRIILSWIFVSMVGSILVAPIGYVPDSPAKSDSQLWRLLFLTPFQATAPVAVMWLSDKAGRRKSNLDGPEPERYSWIPGLWILAVLFLGGLMAVAPNLLRLSILLILIPITTAIGIEKSGWEGQFLRYAVQAVCILIAFDSTARAISQLLIDPHNYVPTNAEFGSG